MKIAGNTRLYIGSTIEQNTEKQTGKTRLFAGAIGMQNPLDTQIAEKRAAAMEKAKEDILNG